MTIEIKTAKEIIEETQQYIDAYKKKKWVSVESLKQWAFENALSQTNFSTFCSDDGIIMFKRSDTKRQGDWSQIEWDEKIKNFEEHYIDYEEFLNAISDEK